MIPFKYAELCDTGKRWYIYYYAINPENGKLQRIRQYINSQKSVTNRKKLAQHVVRIINEKLESGWNPFISDSQKNMFVPLSKALNDILTFKTKFLRARSIPGYRSRIEKLSTWLELTGRQNVRCGEFTESNAHDFMTWLVKADNIGPRTYNNSLTTYRTFWNRLIKTKHTNENVFRSLDMFPEQEKRKRPFTPEEQRKYRQYLERNDSAFLVTSMLCYFCGLRPNEIVQIRLRDINQQRQLITVDPAISKNKKQRIIPVAEKFWPQLMQHVNEAHPMDYIVSRKFFPGDKKIKSIRIAERFREIALELGFDSELKFYSLKDTCADMLDFSGVSTKTIRDLFGHSAIAITDHYMKSINSRALDQLRNDFPDFGSENIIK